MTGYSGSSTTAKGPGRSMLLSRDVPAGTGAQPSAEWAKKRSRAP